MSRGTSILLVGVLIARGGDIRAYEPRGLGGKIVGSGVSRGSPTRGREDCAWRAEFRSLQSLSEIVSSPSRWSCTGPTWVVTDVKSIASNLQSIISVTVEYETTGLTLICLC